MTETRQWIEASIFGSLVTLARFLPRRALLGFGSLAGAVAYRVDHRHSGIARENLRLAFGDTLDDAARERLVRACWRHFGRITADTLAFPRLSADSVGTVVRYEGLEHVRRAYRRGDGVLLFSGHFGHWELTALMQGHLGLPLTLVTRPLDNRRLERMLTRLRGSSGNHVVHKRNAVREMVRCLKDGGGVALVIDQDARKNGIFVPFFGTPASTTPTLALLALRTGAAIIPTFSLPLGDGTYRVVYEPEVPPRRDAERDAEVARLTAACTAIIEGWVRRHPELWLWMHRRWKSRPE